MEKLTATQEKMRVKKLAGIKEALASADEAIVLQAIKDVKKHGDSSIIQLLAETFLRIEDQEVRSEIKNVFYSLKDETSVEVLVGIAKIENFSTIKPFLLSAIWESGIPAHNHISDLVELALNSDYESLLEIMTILDNTDLQSEAEQVEQGLKKIQNRLAESPKDDRASLWVAVSRSLSESLVG